MTTSNPTLADLMYEYVTERIPKCKFKLLKTPIDTYLRVYTGMHGTPLWSWHLGIFTTSQLFINLPNKKVVWIDAKAPGAIDVMYKLIRLSIAERIRFDRKLNIQYPLAKKDRINPND